MAEDLAKSLFVCALSLGMVAGCASRADGSPVGEEDLALRSGGHAYECVSDEEDPDTGKKLTMAVRVSERRLTADGTSGELDESYRPRGNVGFVRFTGFTGLGGDEYTATILAESKLRDGAEKGRIKVQYTGETFATTEYFCTRR